jgi:hypothetical protein
MEARVDNKIDNSIAHKPPSTALLQVDKLRSKRSAMATAHLTKLAVMLGESMDEKGLRLRLMAEELSDLPAEATEHAVRMWSRGDKSHLKGQLRDDASVGIFFPKPAQLRQIAEHYLTRQQCLANQRAQEEDRKRWLSGWVQEQPEELRPLQCARCGEPLTSFSPTELRHMADVVERRWLQGIS